MARKCELLLRFLAHVDRTVGRFNFDHMVFISLGSSEYIRSKRFGAGTIHCIVRVNPIGQPWCVSCVVLVRPSGYDVR